MGRRIDCNIDGINNTYIVLPDIWLGKHVQRRDDAINKATDQNLGETLTDFAVAMALLDDWQIPALPGNVDNWDFQKLDLRLIAWIRQTVLVDFNKCFIIPKVLSSPLQDGQMERDQT